MSNRNPIPADIGRICEMFEIPRGRYQSSPPDDNVWQLTVPPVIGRPPIALFSIKSGDLTVDMFEDICVSEAGRAVIRRKATISFPGSFDYYGGFDVNINYNDPATCFKALPIEIDVRSLDLHVRYALLKDMGTWPLIYLVGPGTAFAYTDSPYRSVLENMEDMFRSKYELLTLTPRSDAKQKEYRCFLKDMSGPIFYYSLISPFRLPENWLYKQYAEIEDFLDDIVFKEGSR